MSEDTHAGRRGRAYVAMKSALRTGRLVRPATCEECGRDPGPSKTGRTLIQGHHADYTKPLEVEWLCISCHAKRPKAPRGEPPPDSEPRLLTVWLPAKASWQLEQLVAHFNEISIGTVSASAVVRYAIQQLYQEQFGETT